MGLSKMPNLVSEKLIVVRMKLDLYNKIIAFIVEDDYRINSISEAVSIYDTNNRLTNLVNRVEGKEVILRRYLWVSGSDSVEDYFFEYEEDDRLPLFDSFFDIIRDASSKDIVEKSTL